MSSAPAGSVDRRSLKRRAVVASTVGTTIEWYDFFLYNTASALVFGPLFFNNTEAGGVLAAFATQFVGFAARPIGAAVFGHYGDRIGRKQSLVATLLIMGVATILIGLLPTYDTIGVAAPILLIVLRILQGIGVGGEWGGSVLMAMEWGHRRQRGLMASWPQVGVPLGLATGTSVVYFFADGPGFLAGGWRVPFIASVVLIGIGLYVRLRVLESPAFAQVKTQGAVVKLPLADVFRDQWRDVLKALLVRTAEQAPFYIFTSFVLVYGTDELGLPRTQILLYLIIAACIGIVSVPFFGWLSDVLGRRVVYGVGAVLTGAYAFPYFGLLNASGWVVLLGVALGLVFHDMMYGPQAALISESFGTGVRYSGAGLGYQLASITAGGPAPLIATAILAGTGSTTWISVYIIGCAVVTLAALATMHPRPPEADERYDQASEDHAERGVRDAARFG